MEENLLQANLGTEPKDTKDLMNLVLVDGTTYVIDTVERIGKGWENLYARSGERIVKRGNKVWLNNGKKKIRLDLLEIQIPSVHSHQ